jgi:hypothetical protein
MAEDTQKYLETAIPAILLILIALVVAAQVFSFCPPVIGDLLCPGGGKQVLIITNVNEKADAQVFARDVSSRVTKITPVILDNVLQQVRKGAITSGKYDLVILFGDQTALTDEARGEITDYVEKGGSLIILRAAGVQQMNTDGSISPFVFNWAVGDMARIAKFQPDCPSFTICAKVAEISVLPSQMASDVQLVPVQYDHPIIQRIGLTSPLPVDITKYPTFKGVILAEEPSAANKISWFEWRDANGKPQSTSALIGYSAGVTGGRVVFLAYNPLELDQEDLFREVIKWATKET